MQLGQQNINPSKWIEGSESQMRGYSKKISRDLISRICNSMNHTVREGTSKSKNEPGT